MTLNLARTSVQPELTALLKLCEWNARESIGNVVAWLRPKSADRFWSYGAEVEPSKHGGDTSFAAGRTCSSER